MRPRCRWYQQSRDNLYQYKEMIAESLTGMLAEHFKPIAESLTGMLAEHYKQVDEHFALARAMAEGDRPRIMARPRPDLMPWEVTQWWKCP